MSKLVFGEGNAKIPHRTFSLPAGWTCPSALNCLARADKLNGKITDGKHTQFRCFAASMESLKPSVRISRWNNFNLLKGLDRTAMRDLILRSLPMNAPIIRIHVSGDFFNEEYFLAWLDVAAVRPQTIFYAYTKRLDLWVSNRDKVPTNFHLNASRGGKHDHLIAEHKLKSARVVYSPEEAQELELEIDHDDSHCWQSERDFALLIHGAQPKGSRAAQAVSELRKLGYTGYSSKNNGALAA